MALNISSPLPTVGGDSGTWGTELNTAITEIINEAGKDSDIVSLQSTKADKTNPVLDGTATGTATTTTGEANKLVKTNSSGNINLTTGANYLINSIPLKDVSETLTNKTLISPEITNVQNITIYNEDIVGTALALKSYGASPAQAGNGTAITFGVGGNYATHIVGSQIHTVKTNYNIDCALVFSTRQNNVVEEVGRFSSGGYFLVKSLAGIGNRAVYSDAGGTLTNTSSDARVKKNIKNITDTMNVLEVLKNIRGITYNWDTSIEGYENMGDQEEIGVIAQEIEQYIPQVVGENQTGYKSVDYAKLVAFLIETNKALLERIEVLESKVV